MDARHSCHSGLTDKLQRNLVKFTPLDSLIANGFLKSDQWISVTMLIFKQAQLIYLLFLAVI